jgi:predicted Fe-Mo cluster-binding NifX family protein
VYGRALYRGEMVVGPDAGRLVLEEGRRAVRLLVANRLPVAVRFTAIPTVNVSDLPAVAAFAAAEGVERVDVVPHRPVPRAPLAAAGTPTQDEMAYYGEVVANAYREYSPTGDDPRDGPLAWLSDGRLRDVPLASLEDVDPLAALRAAEAEAETPGKVLPPRRAQMVAVATSDGHFVDRSLVDAAHLQVYAVTSERTRWLGTRSLPTGILRHRDGVGIAHEFLRAVSGCQAVVATRFTKRAAVLLDAVGIRAIAAGGHVEDVLDRVSRGTIREPAHGDPPDDDTPRDLEV